MRPFNMKIGYPPEIKARALELYRGGMSPKTLTFMYGLGHDTLNKWRLDAGFVIHKSRNISEIEGEMWHQLVGYEGCYEFSNFGRLKALPRKSNNYTTRIVTHKFTVLGYPFVKLSKDGVDEQLFIHVIMARLFIPNPLNLPEVNHKNLNKGDYRIENLEWSTHADNIRHAYENGAIKHGKLGENMNAKKIACYTKDGVMVKEYSCAKEAAKINGWHNQNLTFAARKGIMSHGLYWKYL